MEKLKIKVIIGSVRAGRFAEKAAKWVTGELGKQPSIEAELLDLKDYPLPFFDEPVSPSYAKDGYDNETYKKWRAKIAEADGFVMVAPEYNHGYSAVLKNALDWVYYEWNRKPVGFVSYGSALGARAIEQLREVAVELQMAPIRHAIHIPTDVYLAASQKEYEPALFAPSEKAVAPFVENLVWWGAALKRARTA